jgi:hypothetical protein
MTFESAQAGKVCFRSDALAVVMVLICSARVRTSKATCLGMYRYLLLLRALTKSDTGHHSSSSQYTTAGQVTLTSSKYKNGTYYAIQGDGLVAYWYVEGNSRSV